jgi:hypothetical protein
LKEQTVQGTRPAVLEASTLINLGSRDSKYYLHEIAEEEDMKYKRILLTAREKQAIVNYCLERRELTPLI